MEANPPGIEKSNQILWSTTSDDQDIRNSSDHVVKSYTCAFCKRGFSNAQALGGHMNIHRRDRAKLRQFAEENLPTLDISTNRNPIEPLDASEERINENILRSSEEKSCTPGRSCTPYREDDEIEELQQLPFFAEKPSSASSDTNVSNSSCTEENGEKRNQLRQSHASRVELDLELRLGPEPESDHEQTSIAITKEFF
ncbi:hypothetical protein ACOSP7_029440 [Xanthoceras sorbifolium]